MIFCSTHLLTSTPMSACTVPLIMLGTKPAWPGASRIVNRFLLVSKDALPTSTVLPWEWKIEVTSQLSSPLLLYPSPPGLCPEPMTSTTSLCSSPWLLARISRASVCPLDQLDTYRNKRTWRVLVSKCVLQNIIVQSLTVCIITVGHRPKRRLD